MITPHYLDSFIDDNYELIYNKYSEVHPDLVHSDFYLEDVDRDDLDELILEYLSEELLDYILLSDRNLTLDKPCKEIMCKQFLKTSQGQKLKESLGIHKDFNELLSYVYPWIKTMSLESIKQTLMSQQYFNFNIDKQLAKLSNGVGILIEPSLIHRHKNGVDYFSLTLTKDPSDEVLKYLPLQPQKLQDFLEILESKNIFVCGYNWNKQYEDSPSILIFGNKKEALEYRERILKI